jgi:hypothetical protein
MQWPAASCVTVIDLRDPHAETMIDPSCRKA